MGLGFLNISSNFTGESQFIVVEWVRSTSQGTPVIGHVDGQGLGAQDDTNQTQIFYTAPHSNRALQVTQLPEVWMVVRFWRSSDGVAKDTMLLELAGNARTGALYPLTRFEYVVDRGLSDGDIWGDPEDGDHGLRDQRLEGGEYWIEERGTGTLLTTEIVDRSDVGGGFDFADPLKTMNSGAVYIAFLITRMDLPGEDSGSAPPPAEVVDDIFILTVNQDYNPVTMGGKTLIANYAATIGTLFIQDLALVADSRFKLQSHYGAQRNVVIQFSAGNTIRFYGTDVNAIVLGNYEDIEILFKTGVAYVMQSRTAHGDLAKLVWSYKDQANTLPADGALLSEASYPRVVQILDSLPASSVVGSVAWSTSSVAADGQTVFANKGKWMREGGNFRPPDLRTRVIKALSALDGSVAAGRYEHQETMSHDHWMANATDNGGTPYLSTNHSTGGNTGYALNGSSVLPAQFKTGPSGGSANIVNNIGLLPLISI